MRSDASEARQYLAVEHLPPPCLTQPSFVPKMTTMVM